jgi:hypothetical protein
MLALFFEVYGAICSVSLVAFIGLVSVAKLRPDFDEEEFDLAELDKLKRLVSSARSNDALSIEPPIIEEPSCSTPPRPVKHSKRPVRRRLHLFHTRKPHTI